uniref:Reverse transcriptase domain-containing protein n=1 Tax=Clytia hemisphaerica TaxID=252671 RepID=A0A7M5V9C2_9CNID
EQSGFRKKRNTNDQLYLLTQKIYEAFNRKSGIDAIFIDFEKCFDKIWKKGLLYKLHLMNIPKKDLNIINSFLHNRNIYIQIENEKSNSFYPKEGLPQGSCLSPLLFILFASDIPTKLNTILSQFADDLALYARTSNNNYNHNIRLQKHLTEIIKWCDKWKLKINIKKTKSMSFTKSPVNYNRKYRIKNQNIELSRTHFRHSINI